MSEIIITREDLIDEAACDAGIQLLNANFPEGKVRLTKKIALEWQAKGYPHDSYAEWAMGLHCIGFPRDGCNCQSCQNLRELPDE